MLGAAAPPTVQGCRGLAIPCGRRLPPGLQAARPCANASAIAGWEAQESQPKATCADAVAARAEEFQSPSELLRWYTSQGQGLQPRVLSGLVKAAAVLRPSVYDERLLSLVGELLARRNELSLTALAELSVALQTLGLHRELAELTAWSLRMAYALALTSAAAGGFAIAFLFSWWQIVYDHHALCQVQPHACQLHARCALGHLCLRTPTESTCRSSGLNLGPRDPSSVLQCAKVARAFMAAALGLQGTTGALLGTAIVQRRCSGEKPWFAPHAAALLAFLAAMSAVISLVLAFRDAMPCCEMFVREHVDVAFGRGALHTGVIGVRPLLAPVVAAAGIAFDLGAATIAGSTMALARRQLEPGITLPAQGSANPEQELYQYTAVPTDPPPVSSNLTASGRLRWVRV